jgi:hypothetical protein
VRERIANLRAHVVAIGRGVRLDDELAARRTQRKRAAAIAMSAAAAVLAVVAFRRGTR